MMKVHRVLMGTTVLSMMSAVLILVSGCELTPSTNNAAVGAAWAEADLDTHMKMMEEMGQLGPNHEFLKNFVGEWDVQGEWYMSPDAEPMPTGGVSKQTLVLGGRYVKQEYTANDPDMPMEGVGYLGYDNATDEFAGVWMDSMSTSMMISKGELDDSGKALTEYSTAKDPLTGYMFDYHSVVRIIDPDTHVFEMYSPGADGTPYKAMVLTYHRK